MFINITRSEGGGGGGGGHTAHILVGMCHGKVKHGGGGLRSGSSVKLGSPKLTCRTRLAGTLAGCNPGALVRAGRSKAAAGGERTA